jgi:hypothetical protein
VTAEDRDIIVAAINAATERLIAALAGARPTGGSHSAPVSSGGGGGARFGNYGQKAGQPVSGAALKDLEFYKKGCLRTLDDPAKSRFHGSERALLDAINAEIARQSGGSGDAPPDFFGGGGPEDEVPFDKLDGRIP